MKTAKLKVKGMHCNSCETLIERAAQKVEGVISIKADYAKETAVIEYDENKVRIDTIKTAINEKGYDCEEIDHHQNKKHNEEYLTVDKRLIGTILGIAGLFVVGYFLFHLTDGFAIPQISQNMGYGLLFAVGLLTGFHCVGMCGGFVVSYTANDAQKGKKPYKSHFNYGLGKVISYTVIGAIFGLIGSIITFTPMIRGVAGILAGLFLVLFGLNMLGFMPWFRRFRLRSPKSLNNMVGKKSTESKSPLVIGLLNGLMIACGPLQAIYIMAAGTGSWIEGAKLLFVFALGTLPVMISFGFLTSFISKRATHRILKASGVVVIILGLIMLNRGLALTGTGYDTSSLFASVSTSDVGISGNAVAFDGEYQVIKMDVTSKGWEPDKFV
ncbi:MAG: sulfite exporter TauE/SafE family protein, partial [Nanoarchaeota archaeon]|nr:sulfite exporter TauE/SafE family protein [Nanoarchaeota archaeon]